MGMNFDFNIALITVLAVKLHTPYIIYNLTRGCPLLSEWKIVVTVSLSSRCFVPNQYAIRASLSLCSMQRDGNKRLQIWSEDPSSYWWQNLEWSLWRFSVCSTVLEKRVSFNQEYIHIKVHSCVLKVFQRNG